MPRHVEVLQQRRPDWLAPARERQPVRCEHSLLVDILLARGALAVDVVLMVEQPADRVSLRVEAGLRIAVMRSAGEVKAALGIGIPKLT
ncbi:MAG: hypothetical protein OXN89_25570 [Bryobacterales bacterium]|nr:hypothetical protein [Bryobacterales bacterium]